MFHAASQFDGNGNDSGSGNGDTGGSDMAFADANDNGEYDEGEAQYTVDQLIGLHEPNTSLIVPKAVGSINVDGNTDISITARNITSAVDMTAERGSIRLNATDGGMDLQNSTLTTNGNNGVIDLSADGGVSLAGSSVTSKKKRVQVKTDGPINLDDAAMSVNGGLGDISLTGTSISARGAELTTKKKSISLSATVGNVDLDDATIRVSDSQGHLSVTGASISLTNADLDTNKGKIELFATVNSGGQLNATDATITINGDLGGIMFRSVGDMTLDAATITTAKEVVGELGTADATLSVTGLVIDDDDDSLSYSPTGVIVDPDRSGVEAGR